MTNNYPNTFNQST